ncbi:polynucleotide kinase-phosphatase [Chitinophaga ginsengisegetis]|uniref:polynucleotide kinase-phosphatase n=1 Tax=Chitinophaga ginsengisegetis TaxID=393003 RepID=UPI000DB9B63B|nr:polynucleotide kinase-phosphatase [Chitinophaga ginsengisegetis]MDR6567735.1 protein phosphatase [Chitinophaga ginsengisegetis]MDR6647710.1 protein phosphatase [Chitinophaga ginsengisegetis]MDR6654060.1 protein phosphatase [Chitinophaga ginsengisegetis]
MSRRNRQLSHISIPELSLVLLIGPSGAGKSTFARRFFKPTEIVSSDVCRGLISDDENNQAVSADAFEVVRFIAAKRLKLGLLTVIDATNVQPEARKEWVRLAREYHVLPVAIVLNMSEKVCQERNNLRSDRNFGTHVIPQQISQLRRGVRYLRDEGFRHIFELHSPEEVEQLETVTRNPLYNNKKDEHGPFDIIGDVHGCYDELCTLLGTLGYEVDKENYTLISAPLTTNADGYTRFRKPVFVGDLVDRGPKSPQVLRLVMNMVNNGLALCVPGNHDAKLLRYLNGKNVVLRHGLEATVAQLAGETPEFLAAVKQFLDGLVSHYVLDDGKLVVAHAGLKENMQGRGSGAVREFCLYGETTGETDEFGLPVRYNWALEYKGKAMVVYGHTPVPEAKFLNNTIDIDTGCVFGATLTALRYPEKILVSVPAQEQYAEPARPIGYNLESALSLEQQYDNVLDIEDFIGKKILQTNYSHSITIREENNIAALEAMSRFTINPRWLIYLPPTMSPAETSREEGMLEHPAEGLQYYKEAGIAKVICEEKHMGSRAVVIVCRDEATAVKRFGVAGEGNGVVYTRTGRSFFNDKQTEQHFIARINAALISTGFYETFETDWVCLDAELMPWSAKAQALLQNQYAAVGTAAGQALPVVVDALQQAITQGVPAQALLEKYSRRLEQTSSYVKAYRQYCWPVESLDDYKLAPFHIMATEGKTYFDKDHEWHLSAIKNICAGDEQLLIATPFLEVEIGNEASEKAAITWWENLTAAGGEGMVIKPSTFMARDEKGLIQPAVKIRGKEYLRIIYGPEYDAPENLHRLRSRKLSGKRSLALREFALGLEGLDRFVNNASLQAVHQCVFGILALESEPVDPRL